MSSLTPTILSSTSMKASMCLPKYNNIRWSEDGQFLLLTERALVVATPYMFSNSSAPASLSDTGGDAPTLVNGGDDDGPAAEEEDNLGNAEDGMMGETDDPTTTSSRSKPRQPRLGQMKWWISATAIPTQKVPFDMMESTDNLAALYYDRDDRTRAKAAVWSPSGVSRWGSCLVAVISADYHVLIYAPASDSITKPFVLIDNVTAKIEKGNEESLPRPKDRASCIAWSSSLPGSHRSSEDGSLLAVAGQRGKMSFWSYERTGAMKMAKELVVPLDSASTIITYLDWSQWIQLDGTSYQVTLAIATSSGSVATLTISQIRGDGASEYTSSECVTTVQEHCLLSLADGCMITALKWLPNGMLAWTKAGMVCFWSSGLPHSTWRGIRSVSLKPLGQWAGSSGLAPCVGLQYRPRDESVIVVTSSLSNHIITKLNTHPQLAQSESIEATLACRDVSFDFAKRGRKLNMRQLKVGAAGNITTLTSGWNGLDDSGSLVIWYGEMRSLNGLETRIESQRMIDILVLDIGRSTISKPNDLIQDIKFIVNSVPPLRQHSPLKLLLPIGLRLLNCEDPAMFVDNLQEYIREQIDVLSPLALKFGDKAVDLFERFWSDKSLDGLRVISVLTQWVMRTFHMDQTISILLVSAISELHSVINTIVYRSVLTWVATQPTPKSGYDKLDIRFLRGLLQLADRDGSEYMTLSQILERNQSSINREGEVDTCPACGGEVESRGWYSSKCPKGHEWPRCAVTRLLITDQYYRICNSCPAVSLLPNRLPTFLFKRSNVSPDGNDYGNGGVSKIEHDLMDVDNPIENGNENGQSLEETVKENMVKQVLNIATACVCCGSRWSSLA